MDVIDEINKHKNRLLNLLDPYYGSAISTRYPYTATSDSTAETTVSSTTIRGGSMSATGSLLSYHRFLCVNSSGAPINFTVKVKFGGTTFISVTGAINPGLGYIGLEHAINNFSASDQQSLGQYTRTVGLAAGTAAATTSLQNFLNYGMTVNTAVDQTFEVTMQMSATPGGTWALIGGELSPPS